MTATCFEIDIYPAFATFLLPYIPNQGASFCEAYFAKKYGGFADAVSQKSATERE